MPGPEPDGFPRLPSPVVIDAVVHAYNLLETNARNEAARTFVRATYGMVSLTGHKGFIGPEDYSRDWGIEELAQLLFVESDVDVATYHAVPLDDYFYDGMVSNEKGIEMRRRWPDRVLFYGAVNALEEPKKVLEHAKYLVEEAGAVGIKLYPERYQGGTTVPVDLASADCDPLLAWAEEHSVVIAIHKVFPAGQGNTDNYRLGDVEAAAQRFPRLQIEVVHSGMAFLDETFFLLQRFENVWANLEVTSALAVKAPRRFADVIGRIWSAGARDRVIFASGCCLVHPQPIIEALLAFEMPEDFCGDYGYPAASERSIAQLMGGNYARLHGLDVADMRQRTKGDEFEVQRAAVGERPEPWSRV